MVLNDMPWLCDLQQTSTRFHINESFVQMYSVHTIHAQTSASARVPITYMAKMCVPISSFRNGMNRKWCACERARGNACIVFLCVCAKDKHIDDSRQ